jgi:cytochrome c1
MKRFALALALIALSAPAFARAPKTYQVTGPVLEVSDDLIVVQKGKEKWEIARTAETKVTGDLKVGAKVTVEYRMTAASAEVKAEKAAKKK